MTNTIHNVPRELLEEVMLAAQRMPVRGPSIRAKLHALLSTPSPAGVDGCKCSMSIRVLGDGCRHCQPQEYIDRLGEMLDEERVELSDAQAIIDGLRGEVERLQMQLAACGVVALANTIESAGEARQMHPDYMSASCSDVAGAVDREIALRTERDQQAQRIGELEGLLLRVQVSLSLDDTEWGYSGAEKYKLLSDIRATLSAGKEGSDG